MKLKSTPPIFCPNPKEPLAFSPYEAQLTGQQCVCVKEFGLDVGMVGIKVRQQWLTGLGHSCAMPSELEQKSSSTSCGFTSKMGG
ncbi:MAG: hypothetical protein WCF85_14910 [Rhodospirillaceae bacterium]